MKPFRVGDRVSWCGMRGTVEKSDDSAHPVGVSWDHNCIAMCFTTDGRFHLAQTRPCLKHLRKVNKKRMGFWVKMGRTGSWGSEVVDTSASKPNDPTGWIYVEEVKHVKS